ncbi:MAG: GNAT family N-acetyltransferase [Bryobacterales bacterium]|nr:GNAT family N-acetyltransferase [Bryobacterales bacterium]
MSRTGPSAVTRYYDWQFLGPQSVTAQGVHLDGRLAGFCISGVFQAAMLGFLRRNLGLLAREIVRHPRLLFTPLFAERLLFGVYLFLRPRGEAAGPLENPYRILSLAVHPDFQGRGVGRALLEAAELAALASGVSTMSLRVDPLNETAIRLYKNHGWRESLEAGKWRGLMVRVLAVHTVSPATLTLGHQEGHAHG